MSWHALACFWLMQASLIQAVEIPKRANANEIFDIGPSVQPISQTPYLKAVFRPIALGRAKNIIVLGPSPYQQVVSSLLLMVVVEDTRRMSLTLIMPSG
jgi:hypothetical protein